jgi:choline-sulfatase
MRPKLPNILLIMADQMAHNAIGALGHPTVKTPNLDALAGSGVVFKNCYCNSPLCTPSRASFVTGMHIRNNAVYDNGAELPASAMTVMHHLRRAGYDTILAGKMHFIGPDQLHGYHERLTTDIYPAGFDWTPDWTLGAVPNPGTSVARLQEPRVCDWNVQMDYDEEVLFRTLEKLRALRNSENPFFLTASFTHPHCPFRIPKEYYDLYEGVDIPMPSVPAGDAAGMHPYNQWMQIHHECDAYVLTEDEIRDNRRAYYGMMTYFDELTGRIVNELTRLGMRDDTVIVVTSDHGEMLGEHGMWFKRTFFDPAAKVPLIVSWPGWFEAKPRTEVVSLVDLSATLLDLAWVHDRGEWLGGMDGDSLMGLLEDSGEPWKNEALVEYYAEGTIRGMAALVRGRHKYVYVQNHEPLLFDLEADPHETVNLAGDPRYAALCAEMRAAIDPEQVAAVEKRVLQSQRVRLALNDTQLEEGVTWGWDFQPDADASKQYFRD